MISEISGELNPHLHQPILLWLCYSADYTSSVVQCCHSTFFNSSLTNKPYSKIPSDFNPIHIDPYFSDYATFPGTITHGLWSSVFLWLCYSADYASSVVQFCHSTIFNSPLTNEPYLKIPSDFNSIHIDPYFSNYATLRGTITHGLWSSVSHQGTLLSNFNPIHIDPYFSNYATLLGTITHGPWSSAATHCYVENVVAQGHPDRVLM